MPVQVNLQRARLRTALNEQKTLLVKDFSGFFVRSTVSSSLRTYGIGLGNSAANDFISPTYVNVILPNRHMKHKRDRHRSIRQDDYINRVSTF